MGVASTPRAGADPADGARRAVALCACLVLSACVETGAPVRVEIAGDTAATGVSFELAGPGGAALLVPVTVNGSGPYNFVLDTGATLTCIDSALGERLELERDPAGRGLGVGIGQQPGTLELVRFDSLRVGAATAIGLSGCAIDLSRFRELGLAVDGLLGLNYLREFRVTLDFRSERLELEG